MSKPRYEYPFYVDMVEPNGHLTLDRRTHACWYYYLLAQKLFEKVGKYIEDQIRYEGELWKDKRYDDIAKGVSLMYKLDSPADFLKPGIMQLVERQIRLMEFPAPDPEYWVMKPRTINV